MVSGFIAEHREGQVSLVRAAVTPPLVSTERAKPSPASVPSFKKTST
jgi:hypothetical protein